MSCVPAFPHSVTDVQRCDHIGPTCHIRWELWAIASQLPVAGRRFTLRAGCGSGGSKKRHGRGNDANLGTDQTAGVGPGGALCGGSSVARIDRIPAWWALADNWWLPRGWIAGAHSSSPAA